MYEIDIPDNFNAEPGDECVKITFDPVENADGYKILFFNSSNSENAFRTRYAEKSGKKFRGFKNDTDYLVCACAFILDEDDNERYGPTTQKISFTPFSNELKAPAKICLSPGESTYIECSYKTTIPYAAYVSNNPNVATVSEDGLIKAVSVGEADIISSIPCDIYAVTSVSVGRNLTPSVKSAGRIIFTGDIMCSARQQRKSSVYSYDFNSDMKMVCERFLCADHVIGNLETMTYDGAPYESEQLRTQSGSPNCNSPSTFLDALKNTGFNVLITANNHNCDCSDKGLKETISLIKSKGMINSGTLYDNPIYLYSGNVKVALISLNMIKNGLEKNMNLQDHEQALGLYDRDRCNQHINEARHMGAEYIVVYMHWGMMNSHAITESQKNTAQSIAEQGADLIIGTHPHLIQKAEYIHTSDGRQVLCAYSLGNFITSMNEIKGNRDSVALLLDLSKDDDKINARISYMPFYSRLLNDGLSVEPVDVPLGYEQYESAIRIEKNFGNTVSKFRPQIKCFGSVIQRRLFRDASRYDASTEHILLSPASLFGTGTDDFNPTEYTRVNSDISKDFWNFNVSSFNEYCMIDFYAAASLNLYKLGDNYYTASDAFKLSSFYIEHEGEFELIEQPAATDICAMYLERLAHKLLELYPRQNIILLRSRIPSVCIKNNELKYKKSYKSLNNRIEWLEDLFIIYARPTIIDISPDYFADNSFSDSVSEYEDFYYMDVLKILDDIVAGSISHCHHTLNADTWYKRVILYYDALEKSGHFDWICKEQDAADLLVMHTSRSFLSEHGSEIIYLKENRVKNLDDIQFIDYMTLELKQTANDIIDKLLKNS
ncbi:MAG: CapA family protein [Lachnospiraceae bacterium]|nr:CapA family protein [Lachnospiraceae bacterium]